MRASIRWEVTGRVYGGARSRILEELATYDRSMEKAVIRSYVKANIVVKEVSALATNDPWEKVGAALVLTESDSGAQRSFFRTVEFGRCGSKQFGPTLMESAWCDKVSRRTEIVPVEEIRRMGETARQANMGVRRRGIRATVLTK